MNTTVIDLTEILNADIQKVSYGLLLRAVFHCIGAALCKCPLMVTLMVLDKISRKFKFTFDLHFDTSSLLTFVLNCGRLLW